MIIVKITFCKVTSLPGDRTVFDIFGEKVSSTVTADLNLLSNTMKFFPTKVKIFSWKVEPKNYSISLLHKAIKWDNIDMLHLLFDNGYNVDDCFNTDYYM